MFVYILRHGHAARPSPDQAPSLTAIGQREIQRIAGAFKGKRLGLTHLWHSPKDRAVQTARIFQEVLADPSLQVEEKERLIPDGNPDEVFGEIGAFKGGSLLIVSHLPLVGDLASLLAGDSPHPHLIFPTGGLFAFERSKSGWKYLWNLDPASIPNP
jgi:phosphohistidine phosphatase